MGGSRSLDRRYLLTTKPLHLAVNAPAMTPAEPGTPKVDAAFSIRRRVRDGRCLLQVSSSVSAMAALRARIRAQSKQVAAHIEADADARSFISDWSTPAASPIHPNSFRGASAG